MGLGLKYKLMVYKKLLLLLSEPKGDSEQTGGIIYPIWPGDTSRIPQEELERVIGEREEWVLLLDLLYPSHVRDDSREDVPTATVLFYHSRILSNA